LEQGCKKETGKRERSKWEETGQRRKRVWEGVLRVRRLDDKEERESKEY
jgi:hypothetical protein